MEMESHPVLEGGRIVDLIKGCSHQKVVITGWAQTHNNSYWHVKTDSTCGGGEKNGWEIVSYKGTGDFDADHISSVAEILGRSGLRCGEDCGFHVHVDISDFDAEQAAVLLAIWLKLERVVMESVPRHRSRSRHCRAMRGMVSPKGKRYGALEFWHLFSPKNFSVHGNREKKVSMNLVNFATCLSYEKNTTKKNLYCDASRKTAEFRFPEGTFSKEDVRNWIWLFVLFVDSVQFRTMPSDLLSAKSVNEFVSLFGLDGNDTNKSSLRDWISDRIVKNAISKKWKNAFIRHQAKCK